jgi:glutathione synthase/RimK-type ligase-like ATP-grasp enzyme
MRRVAFLSDEATRDSRIQDFLLVEPLKERGWIVDARVPWRQFRTIDWTQYDVVVVRSTWDYQDDLPLFHQALEHITTSGRTVRVENDVALMRWNSSKLYMRDMAARGCPIIPTMFVADAEALKRGVSSLVDAALTVFPEVVLKPCVSAGSRDTLRLAPSDLAVAETRAHIDRIFAERPCLVQPFLPDILVEGEYSLVYFAGQLSHAIRKVPAAGDFRVQEQFGSRVQCVDAASVPEPVRAVALRAIAALPVDLPPLYARVDIVPVGNKIASVLGTVAAADRAVLPSPDFEGAADPQSGYAIIEVELIEPCLFFKHAPEGIKAFCDAFCERFDCPTSRNA